MRTYWKEILALGAGVSMIILAAKSDGEKSTSLLDKALTAFNNFSIFKNLNFNSNPEE